MSGLWWDLTPPSFECPTHKLDLTELVRAELEEDVPPVAYDGLPRLGGRRSARPFEVIVTCPGDGPDSVHSLTCAGTYG